MLAACSCLIGRSVAAQPPQTAQAPSPQAGAAAPDAPAAAPVQPPAAAPVPPSAAASPDAPPPAAAPPASVPGPLVGYVKHTQPPVLVDSTPATAGFAMIGAVAAIASGHDIVVNNAIQDPSGDMARDIANAFATAKAARVADAPLLDAHLWTRAKAGDLSAQANGAAYVVDVEPPGMTLIYFSFDWTHFDLMYASRVRIIDTADGKVVAQARCFLKSQKTPGVLTHSELLADNAAALKRLIASKSEACLTQMKSALKL